MTPSRPLYPQLGRHQTLGTPSRLDPLGMGSPQRSPVRNSTRVVAPPPATPRTAISVNRGGSQSARRSSSRATSVPMSASRFEGRSASARHSQYRNESAQAKVSNQMTALHELMARDSIREEPRRGPSASEFKFRSGMPLDLPLREYDDNRPGRGAREARLARDSPDEDHTITKKRRVEFSTENMDQSRSAAKNVRWNDERESEKDREIAHLRNTVQTLVGMVQELGQNQLRMENKIDSILRLSR